MYQGAGGYSSAYGGAGVGGMGGYSALPTAYGGGGGYGSGGAIPRSTSPSSRKGSPFKRGGSGGGAPSPAAVAFTRVLLVAALLGCAGLFYSVTHHRDQHAQLSESHGRVRGELEAARAELYHARTALDSHRAAAAEAELSVEQKAQQRAASERAAEAARATHLESRLTDAGSKLSEAEGRARELQEALNAERAKRESAEAELAEARRLDEAYRQYLQEEVDAHRAREENWMHVQREWEDMERELTAELSDLRKQAKAGGLVFKAGGYLEGLGAPAAMGGGAAAGAAGAAAADDHHPHLPKHVEAEAARALPADLAKDMARPHGEAAAGGAGGAVAGAQQQQQQQQQQAPAAAAAAAATTAAPAAAAATTTTTTATAPPPAPATHTHHDDAHGHPEHEQEHHDGWLHGVGEWLHGGGHHHEDPHAQHGPPADAASAAGGGNNNAREMHRQQLEAEQELHHFYADYPGMPENEVAASQPAAKRAPNKVTGGGKGGGRAAAKAAAKEAQKAAKALAAAQAAAQAQAQQHADPHHGHHHHVADDLSWKLGLMAGGGLPADDGHAVDAGHHHHKW